MHCAFAMMIGGTGFRVCRHWLSKAFWACWPLLVTWVVIVTANHYWVDAALGWMVARDRGAGRAALLARARPEAWSFRVEPGRARPRPSVGPRPRQPTSLSGQWNLRRPPGPRAAAATAARPAAPRSSGPTLAIA